ncbi:hypothetical protein EOD41_07115 [Mucilaginibacter limnophilus]|uniref:Outer membrane protein beta-barrel domain-containing protein n=1 Tax=Mucilaginibacter limnophilus TaxID=1932778 RepID=A0A3S2UM66_9SPHI|nr:hypothetical protein [Mucilaginibacter limnophilus]RVU01723.1 hypothetical protein EOD41_07115 [Mucilaginibacter limnophilus]
MNYKLLLTLAVITFSSAVGFGQARSSIGLGLTINKPLSSDYHFGHGLDLQGSIRVSDQIAILPELGYRKIYSNGRKIYRDGYLYTRLQDLGTVYLGVGGKYYFTNRWFAGLGANLHISGGNEDIV